MKVILKTPGKIWAEGICDYAHQVKGLEAIIASGPSSRKN
jgi:hypothetical protein